MESIIQIACENNSQTIYVKEGATLSDILDIVKLDPAKRYIAAFVNNKARMLSYRVFSPKSVRFIALDTTEGMRIYARSLFFMLQKAIADIIPGHDLRMMHPVGRGFYCEIDNQELLTHDTVQKIKSRMHEIANLDLPIVREIVPFTQAREMFERNKWNDKILMMDTRPRYYVTIYNLGGLNGYFYGTMVYSTSYLKVFNIEKFGDGLVILMPSKHDHEQIETMWLQPKLFDVFRQNKVWADIIKVSNVGELNQRVLSGGAGDLIKIGEALQEKNFAQMADLIFDRHARGGAKVILIAGPSSSGKTTFSKRLAIQLQVLGLDPHNISLDNYFVNREQTPRDENGNYDFESIEAIDIDTFNNDLLKLFAGERVELCEFNFHDGRRVYGGQTMQISQCGVLIVEGIHALNPILTEKIDSALQFKIYASALTTLAIDNMSVIPTTDNRLLRRIVRDHKYRSRSAHETIKGWPSVRRGEDRHIFPFQEQADVMFGTALFFELAILKQYALPLLAQVPANTPESAEALRLTNFLNCFVDIPDTELPPTSILREFIGGSSFKY